MALASDSAGLRQKNTRSHRSGARVTRKHWFTQHLILASPNSANDNLWRQTRLHADNSLCTVYSNLSTLKKI